MRWCGLWLACLVAGPAFAHPHIFIESALVAVVDESHLLKAVRVVWTYDELYTLMLLGDLGLDADADGILTAEEQAKLLTAESTWVAGYEGDTYGTFANAPIAFGLPTDFAVSMKDGKITSSHVRPLVTTIDLGKGEVSLKSYDPYYYAAFTLSGGAEVEGVQDCDITYVQPDLAAAYTKLDDMLYGPGSAELPEGEYPQIGGEFADEAKITCVK
jgi:ABC-type uncharacterized transport system substrate-binding protein